MHKEFNSLCGWDMASTQTSGWEAEIWAKWSLSCGTGWSVGPEPQTSDTKDKYGRSRMAQQWMFELKSWLLSQEFGKERVKFVCLIKDDPVWLAAEEDTDSTKITQVI